MKNFKLKERPKFYDHSMEDDFMDWYNVAKGKRMQLDHELDSEDLSDKDREDKIKDFYRKLGMISNDLFNEISITS